MTLAHRLGLPERRGYVPGAFAVTAFALGVQIALVTEAFGAQPYPPAGKAALAWISGAILGLSLVLHVPWARLTDGLSEMAPSREIPRRAVYLAPHEHQPRATIASQTEARNGHTTGEPADLTARLHSPLNHGPVLAPGEEADFTLEAEPEELARELEVRISIHGPDGSHTIHEAMQGTQLERTVSFEKSGSFTVAIELDHPEAEPVAKTLRGRVAPYREEIARLFEQLKEDAAREGLDVGPESTPREVCRQLRTVGDADPAELADLAVELEVALYGDETVDRSSYETVYQALASTGLLGEEIAREVQP